MAFEFTPIIFILLLSAFISIINALIAIQQYPSHVSITMTAVFGGIAWWNLMVALGYAVIGMEHKIYFAKFEYIGSYGTAFLLLLFVLQYTEIYYKIPKIILALLPLPYIACIILAFSNDWHGLLWGGFEELSNNTLLFIPGPGYALVLAVAYLNAFVLIGLLIFSYTRSGALYRRQIKYLIISILLPFVGHVIYLFRFPALENIDLTPISFAFSNIIILIAVFGARLLDLTPIARKSVVDQITDGVLVFDFQDRVVDINPSMKKMLEVGEDVMGMTFETLFNPYPEMLSFLSSDNQNTQLELVWDVEQGKVFDIHLTQLDQRGQTLIFRDISVRYRMEQQLQSQLEEIKLLKDILEDQATRDSLTQAHNRRYFWQQTEEWIVNEETFFLGFLDIDNFKNINDSYGHAVGDQVLMALVQLLSMQINENELLCRYGGEEFVIVLKETSAETAIERFDLMRSKFSNHLFERNNFSAAFSMGIAVFPLHGNTIEIVLENADKALYTVKRSGKNKVALWKG